ncbi:Ankyrin repeat-containing domain [Phytophthora cactorum]|nr:Ankyrin repeat-containing domain [Phytophthora cactorum]
MDKRVRSESDAAQPDAIKRIRSGGDVGSDSATSLERAKRQCFPAEIQALPHVLKLIETMLMTPDEAILEATKTGQSEWALEILGDFECDSSEAFYQAAIRGDTVITQMLIDKFLDDVDGQVLKKTAQAMQRAAVAAAETGRLQIVQLLFPEIFVHRRAYTPRFMAARDILDAAAASGSLEIVKFMVEHAEEKRYVDRYSLFTEVDTLTRGIVGGHADRLRWNLQRAYIAAMKRGDKDLSERIYDIYPRQFNGKNLFAGLAASGYLEAVKYLFNSGHDDEEAVGKAFKSAGGCKTGVAILEFLLGTGRVTQNAIDKAFQKACARQENMDVVTQLYNTKQVSQQGINRAFATVNSVAAMRLMYDNEKISDGSLIGAFKKSTNRGGGDTIFLSKEKCIPPELISHTFVAAVKNEQMELIDTLRCNTRVTDQALSDAIEIAATRGDAVLLKLLYDHQRVSHDVLLKAFREAARHGHFETAKVIVSFLSVRQHVPQEYTHKAFVVAARLGTMTLMETMCENRTAGWPLEVLKAALDVAAGNSKIVNLICKIVSDQVFSKHLTN